MSVEEQVHRMVGRPSESDLLTVGRMLDGLLKSAPEDDESATEEDRLAVAEGSAACARGEGAPLEEFARWPGG